jgi:hypothetical protein
MSDGDAELPFERHEPNAYEWTDKAFDELTAGRLQAHVHRRDGLQSAVITGACPRCTHTFTYTTSPHAIGTGAGTRSLGPAGGGAADGFVAIDVPCWCVGEHADRQPGEHGCGIVFRIEVRPEVHGG